MDNHVLQDNDALQDLLSAHADALNEGHDSLAQLLRTYPTLSPQVRALMALAWQLKQALAPVPVPQPFRAELGQQLQALPRAATDGESQKSTLLSVAERRPPLWMGAAALGSLLPLLGLLLFWRRRQRNHPLAGAT